MYIQKGDLKELIAVPSIYSMYVCTKDVSERHGHRKYYS
jgi:hypothetical protein